MSSSDVDLKHYNSYFERLENVANALGLKIIHKRTDEDGVIVPSRNTIYLDTDLNQSTEIAVLLHELGHALDFITSDDSYLEAVDKAYYTKKPKLKHKRLRMRCERDAWENGRRLAKVLKIKLGKWYDEEVDYYLKSHKQG